MISKVCDVCVCVGGSKVLPSPSPTDVSMAAELLLTGNRLMNGFLKDGLWLLGLFPCRRVWSPSPEETENGDVKIMHSEVYLVYKLGLQCF